MFGAVPVFLVRAVLAAAGLPVGISEARDLVVGWGWRRNGWALVGIATHASNLGSFAAMCHGGSDTIVIPEVASASAVDKVPGGTKT